MDSKPIQNKEAMKKFILLCVVLLLVGCRCMDKYLTPEQQLAKGYSWDEVRAMSIEITRPWWGWP